jgi:Zn-dependent peptidase ImmA (M78 family)/transcriptional regulator with XRE-family HTH domain
VQQTSDGLFCGPKLRIAREFRMLTQSELAKRVFASPALISLLEAGRKKQPQSDLVQAFAKILRFEPKFFYGYLRDVLTEDECSFRHRRTTPERIKAQVRAHGTLIALVISRLRSRHLIPAINLPRTTASTIDEIELVAQKCREHWKLHRDEPILQVRQVLEDAGITIIDHLVKSKEVDTFSCYGAHAALIFPNEQIQSGADWKFEVAHELGHLLIHRDVTVGNKQTEEAANLFAGALLMPSETFTHEFRELPFSWPHIFELKKRWGVTTAAVLSRAYNLKLIEAVEYRKALKHMSAKGWRDRESHTSQVPRSGRLEEVLKGLGQKANLTLDLPIEKLCAELLFTQDTFREVTGITIVPERTELPADSLPASSTPAAILGAEETIVPAPIAGLASGLHGLETVKPGVKSLFLLRGANNVDRAQHCGQAERSLGIEIWFPEYIDRPSLRNVERFWVIINRSDIPETNERFLRSIAADDQIREKALVATVADESKLIDLFKWVLNEQRAQTFHESTLQYVYGFSPLPLLSNTRKISELVQPPEPPQKHIKDSWFDNSRWQY